MKKFIKSVSLLALLLSPVLYLGQSTPEAQQVAALSHGSEPGEGQQAPFDPPLVWTVQTSTASLPFYPGLRGWGTQMQGGSTSSATWYIVSNTNTSGSGSFADALSNGCPKVIYFEISGRIDQGDNLISPTCVGTTVACQTAPSPGILFEDMMISTRGDDFVWWHCDFRVGDEVHDPETMDPNNRDSLALGEYAVNTTRQLCLNCTIAWAVDGNLDIFPNTGPPITTTYLTIWQTLIAQALKDSLHPQGEHSTGLLANRRVSNLSIGRTVFAHNQGRSPHVQSDLTSVGNTIVYNPGNWEISTYGGLEGELTEVNVENNLYIKGADSTAWPKPIHINGSSPVEWSAGNPPVDDDFYEAGNGSPDFTCVNHGCVRNLSDDNDPFVDARIAAAYPEGWVQETFNDDDAGRLAFAQLICAHVGARPTDRIAGDIAEDICGPSGHIIDDLNGLGNQGSIPDTVAEAGGYPTMAENSVDYSMVTGHCAATFPGSPNDTEASGYTKGQEWLIQCADGVMPADWRPLTLTAD